MDKEKQIEEMMKDIGRGCAALVYGGCDDKTCRMCLAKHFLKQGYCKITENEVVISKEEYEEIWRNGWNEGYSEILVDTIKKTAEKILLKIKEVKTQDCGYTDWLDDTYFGDEFMKLAKEFGVDSGEE